MPIPIVTSTGTVLPTKWLKPINQFFVSVSEHLPNVDPSILSSLTNDYSTDFVIFPEEVEWHLEKINIHKAPGPDGLPSWFLSDFASYICAFSALTLLVGWQEGHPACKKRSGWVLAWLSVWSEVQTCIWPS